MFGRNKQAPLVKPTPQVPFYIVLRQAQRAGLSLWLEARQEYRHSSTLEAYAGSGLLETAARKEADRQDFTDIRKDAFVFFAKQRFEELLAEASVKKSPPIPTRLPDFTPQVQTRRSLRGLPT